jgi:hypothetical protein
MRNTMRTITQKMMVGVALLGGVLGAGTVAANAAPIEFHERFEAGYIPPCPGDGYVWTAGYYNGGYWVPGAWAFRGHRGFDRGYAYYGGGNRFDNDHRYAFRDRDDRRFEGRRDEGRRYEGRGEDRGHNDFHGRR